ncbi:MAG: SpoIIE family protein phosphatase, partial [Planctomycetota bacterium]
MVPELDNTFPLDEERLELVRALLVGSERSLGNWAGLLKKLHEEARGRPLGEKDLIRMVRKAGDTPAAREQARKTWERIRRFPMAAGLLEEEGGEYRVDVGRCRAVSGKAPASGPDGEPSPGGGDAVVRGGENHEPDVYRAPLQTQASREKEMQRARAVQHGMLPRPPLVPGLTVGTYYEPCEEIGGDFFDFFPVGPHELGVVIGDVAGHGIDSALVMAMAKKALQMHCQGRSSPREALIAVNRDLHGELPYEKFVTVGYGVLDLSRGVFRFVRAGHTPLIRIPGAEGEPDTFEPSGMAVGMAPNTVFEPGLEEVLLDLAPGDTLLWTTDGFEEAADPEGRLYGTGRLASAGAVYASTDVELGTECIVDGLRRFTEGAKTHDDRTLIALRFTGTSDKPLRHTAAAMQSGRTNLTPSVDRFFGRVKETKELHSLLVEEGKGLVTVLGPGGIGKTSVARQLGLKLLDRFPGGVWFVDLTETQTGAEVAVDVARALGASLPEGPPEKGVADLLEFRRPLLIILDNFEQVVEAAHDTVERWREAAPHAKFLVTSRAALDLGAEKIYRLDPLPAPPREYEGLTKEEVEAFDSVQLFVERARSTDPDFALTDETAPSVAAICDGLDGIPLAVELAAARVGVMNPRDIASKLHQKFTLLVSNRKDRPARHRTLKATIDFSYDLLSDHERHAFEQLSSFRGGCDLEAAESVISTDDEAPPVIDLVQSLRNKSFVAASDSPFGRRFSLFPVMREYAEKALEKSSGGDGLSALRERHAAHFANFSERWAGKLHGPEQLDALTKIELEMENLWEAADRMTEDRKGELVARVLVGVVPTLRVRPRSDDRMGGRLEAALGLLD